MNESYLKQLKINLKSADTKRTNKLRKPIHEDTTYEQLLSRLSKDELRRIEKRWGFHYPSTFKKDELIKNLSADIIRETPSLLMLIPHPAYSLITDIDSPEMTPEITFETESFLIAMGLGFEYIVDDQWSLYIPESIKTLCITDEYYEHQSYINFEAAVIIESLVRLYGAVTFEYTASVISKLSETDFNQNLILPLVQFYNGFFINIKIDIKKGSFFLINIDNDDFIGELSNREDLEFKEYSLDEMLFVYTYNLTPKSIKYSNILIKYLDKLNILEENDLLDFIDSIIIRINKGSDLHSIIEDIYSIFEIHDTEDAQAILDNFVNLYNNTPQWILKGHSPLDLRPVPIESRKKIGRNEPCPCGSGKKYKKCCMIKDQTSNILKFH